MASGRNTWWLLRLALTLAACLLPALVTATAGERSHNKPRTPAGDNVELFSAMKDGQIEVQLIPKDATQCRLLVKNKTDKPLNVQLPEAFAGVPVLAQAPGAMGGLGGGRNNRASGGMGGGMNQGMMGGMGGMGGMGMGGMGMGGMGMGFMNVPPEKVGQVKVATVCLDHGKADPRPGVKYEIKPLEEYTTKPGLREVAAMLGSGRINQRVAQVAAWHLNNDMSWQQLASKEIRHANGTREPYFSGQEIQGAMQAVTAANNIAQQRKNAEPQQSSRSTSAAVTQK